MHDAPVVVPVFNPSTCTVYLNLLKRELKAGTDLDKVIYFPLSHSIFQKPTIVLEELDNSYI